MSWLPVYNSWMVLSALLGFFLWKSWLGLLFIFLAWVSFLFMGSEVMPLHSRFIFGFWLFICSELVIFISLFEVCLWTSDDYFGGNISDFLELPFLGCFLLIGSSITATAAHHSMGLPLARWLIGATIVLGSGFVLLQIFEFFDCECDLLASAYVATAFCTVGLHFSHVVMGLLGMTFLFVLGPMLAGQHYMDMGVWYWHFVDYIWLLVFLIVYLS